MPGYSGKPLATKLGLKPGYRVFVVPRPENYLEMLGAVPADLTFVDDLHAAVEIIHFFTTSLDLLRERLPVYRAAIVPNGAIWVSWPKKRPRTPATLTEADIRAAALASDLVDVKVCAVDEIWSALKLVIPVALRGAGTGA